MTRPLQTFCETGGKDFDGGAGRGVGPPPPRVATVRRDRPLQGQVVDRSHDGPRRPDGSVGPAWLLPADQKRRGAGGSPSGSSAGARRVSPVGGRPPPFRPPG